MTLNRGCSDVHAASCMRISESPRPATGDIDTRECVVVLAGTYPIV